MVGSSRSKIALIQMLVGADRNANMAKALLRIAEAASKGAGLIVLPECFNSPYGVQYFGDYAESVPGPSTVALSKAAKEHKVYLVGGSIPENDSGKIFNCSVSYGPTGDLLAKHRKVHLFDINVPGKIKFTESDSLSPGADFKNSVFQADGFKVGVGICYDIRFSEMARLYAQQGCELLIYPGAFNMTTGPAHWELVTRARALDNQVYCAVCAPARDTSADYVAWGHSMVVDPWGTVIASAQEEETIVYADIDMARLAEVREMISLTKQRRGDLYDTVSRN